jgi:hypothetical protein
MLKARTCIILFALLISTHWAAAEDDEQLAYSVAELQHAIGDWDVTTEFLAPDGTTARSAEGSYSFSWIIEDRLATGRNAIPDLGMQSGILFYVNEKARTIEMVAVGPDGRLWIMTGPLGGDTRYSQTYADSGGGGGQLRFTRFNVTDNSFESKMEYTEDGGESWKPGNHQVFRRSSGRTDGETES